MGGILVAGVLGIYIHIPFCKSKCDYCDFYSLAGHEDLMDRYQKALITHIKAMAPHCKGRMVDSIYFGGGTPPTMEKSVCGTCCRFSTTS